MVTCTQPRWMPNGRLVGSKTRKKKKIHCDKAALLVYSFTIRMARAVIPGNALTDIQPEGDDAEISYGVSRGLSVNHVVRRISLTMRGLMASPFP